jgi:hypothetical protein
MQAHTRSNITFVALPLTGAAYSLTIGLSSKALSLLDSVGRWSPVYVTCRSEGYAVDSDLADAVEGLKAVLSQRKIDASFEKAAKELVEDLRKQFRIPSRIRAFYLSANPVRVETHTPVERIRLIPAEELTKTQEQARAPREGTTLEWKNSWIVIGESSLLGDPYFLDVSKMDPEGDCPVYTAMSGQERWNPTLAASSFAQFLRILTTAMETAAGFGDAIMDDEDEDSFREALGPKIKNIDVAAMRAGHWT